MSEIPYAGASLTGQLILSPEGWQKLWQPIETAPKDGKPVLAAEEVDDGHWVIKVLSWGGDEWLLWPGQVPYHPSHWIPLPAPPVQ
jgi:hypothetical protein